MKDFVLDRVIPICTCTTIHFVCFSSERDGKENDSDASKGSARFLQLKRRHGVFHGVSTVC